MSCIFGSHSRAKDIFIRQRQRQRAIWRICWLCWCRFSSIRSFYFFYVYYLMHYMNGTVRYTMFFHLSHFLSSLLLFLSSIENEFDHNALCVVDFILVFHRLKLYMLWWAKEQLLLSIFTFENIEFFLLNWELKSLNISCNINTWETLTQKS